MDIFEEIVLAKKEGKPVVLATVVETRGSGPRGQGARMLVKQDRQTVGTIGGGAVEQRVIEEALALMNGEEPRMLECNLKDVGMTCGGSMRIFLEPFNRSPRLVVFGAGHIGSVLSQIVKAIEFHVTVIDNRPDFATPARLPSADQVICSEYEAALGTIPLDADTYLVVVTHGHAHDLEIVRACARRPHRYLGMIGSRAKVKKIFEALRADGIGEEIIAGIHAPIGLDIAANTPAEIAVAIAAELVAVRNQGKKQGARCPAST